MRTKALIGSAVITLALALTGCSQASPTPVPPAAASSSAPAEATSTLQGTFGGENGKNVEGTVTIEDGKVTLSGFSSDEGPDLHLYLTNGTDEAAVGAGTELGAVRFDEASQTFELGSANLSDFTTVVVHCDKAKAVFGAASLA